jgi:predicted nucleic acid-binding protein
MIVVDTNVISELMRAEPHPAVMAWMARQPRAQLYTTRVNQAEILYGIAGLRAPANGACRGGKRHGSLAALSLGQPTV